MSLKSNTEAVLAKVTGALGAAGLKVRCEIGDLEDARRGAPPRIVWCPRGRRYADPTQQREGMKVGHEVEPLYDVHVWGGSYFEAERLEAALLAALFNSFSPNAYELGEAPAPGQPETPNEAKGWEIVIPIRLLRTPIPAEVRPTVTLLGAQATGAVKGVLGEDPSSAAPTVTVPEDP